MTYSASAGTDQPCPRCGDHRHRVLDGNFESVRTITRDLAPGDHAAHVYSDPALIAPFCARYLTEGINKGERVMAVAPADLKDELDGLLAEDVNVAVEWVDPALIYGDFDADRVAAMYDELVGNEPRQMRILAVLDRTSADGVDPSEMHRYECAAHDILNRHGAIGMCLYDSRDLDEGFIDAASARHPLRMQDGAVLRNDEFEFLSA
jgi:hypothetical protein